MLNQFDPSSSDADLPDNSSTRVERRYTILETFLRNRASLRNFISRYIISSHDIEEVSQETCLRAYRAAQKKPIEAPKAFLFQIAKHLVLSELSRKSRKLTDYIEDFEYEAILLDDLNVEASVMAQQQFGIFCEAVATLPPQCCRAVLMKKVYGMSNKEIARRMGIALSTVEKHLVRGIRQCNAIIAERYAERDAQDACKPGNPKVQTGTGEGGNRS